MGKIVKIYKRERKIKLIIDNLFIYMYTYFEIKNKFLQMQFRSVYKELHADRETGC